LGDEPEALAGERRVDEVAGDAGRVDAAEDEVAAGRLAEAGAGRREAGLVGGAGQVEGEDGAAASGGVRAGATHLANLFSACIVSMIVGDEVTDSEPNDAPRMPE